MKLISRNPIIDKIDRANEIMSLFLDGIGYFLSSTFIFGLSVIGFGNLVYGMPSMYNPKELLSIFVKVGLMAMFLGFPAFAHIHNKLVQNRVNAAMGELEEMSQELNEMGLDVDADSFKNAIISEGIDKDYVEKYDKFEISKSRKVHLIDKKNKYLVLKEVLKEIRDLESRDVEYASLIYLLEEGEYSKKDKFVKSKLLK